jgi:hypothetical protein
MDPVIFWAIVALIPACLVYYLRKKKREWRIHRTITFLEIAANSLSLQLLVTKDKALSDDWACGYVFGWPFALASQSQGGREVDFSVPSIIFYYQRLSPDQEWNKAMWHRSMSLGEEEHNNKVSLEWRAGRMAALHDAQNMHREGLPPVKLLEHFATKQEAA